MPDIVLMDISMPGLGGLEAARVIRKIPSEAKILLLTLHDSMEWAETALRAGARGHRVNKIISKLGMVTWRLCLKIGC